MSKSFVKNLSRESVSGFNYALSGVCSQLESINISDRRSIACGRKRRSRLKFILLSCPWPHWWWSSPLFDASPFGHDSGAKYYACAVIILLLSFFTFLVFMEASNNGSLFVRISTPSKSLDEYCLVDASNVARSRPLGLPTKFSNEVTDASRVDTDVDRPVS